MNIIYFFITILGASLIVAYIFKKLYNLSSIDEAYKILIRSIMTDKEPIDIINESTSDDTINENLLLIDDEWLELADKFTDYFMNISLLDYTLTNGLIKVTYAINGTKKEFSNDDSVLRRAIAMDIHNYYLKKRCVIVHHIYIQTLTKNTLIFCIGCNENGRKTIEQYNNLDVEKMKQQQSTPELVENISEESHDSRL